MMGFQLIGSVFILCLHLCLFAEATGMSPINITGASESMPVPIKCSNTSTTDVYTWMHNGQDIVVNGNNTYEITKSDAVGIYNCTSGAVSNTYQAMNYSVSYIEHTGKSIYTTEGDVNTTLICHSYSYPDPTFSWTRIKEGEKLKLTNDSAQYVIKTMGTKSSLVITTITFESRANYWCISKNKAGSGNSTVLVRVQGKLAALWPFLGILGEVIILAIVMLAISRREKKEPSPDSPAVSRGSRSGANTKED